MSLPVMKNSKYFRYEQIRIGIKVCVVCYVCLASEAEKVNVGVPLGPYCFDGLDICLSSVCLITRAVEQGTKTFVT